MGTKQHSLVAKSQSESKVSESCPRSPADLMYVVVGSGQE